MEGVYGLSVKRLVCPLSFMQNVSVYTKTGSRYGSENLSAADPAGTYPTLQDSIKSLSDDGPVVYPVGDLVQVLDNEQFIGKKRGVKPAHQVRASFVTNRAYVEVNPGKPTAPVLQAKASLIPTN